MSRSIFALLFSWTAALVSLSVAFMSARDVGATIETLPAPAWRGAPLRAPVRELPAEDEAALPSPQVIDGAYELELARITFDDYDPPELRLDPTPLGAEAYPPAIAEYNGSEVILSGFPQPLELEAGRVRILRLTRYPPGCCFGALPQYDEWALVRLAGEGIESPNAYEELRLRGRLELGERVDADGVLESLYRLEDARAE